MECGPTTIIIGSRHLVNLVYSLSVGLDEGCEVGMGVGGSEVGMGVGGLVGIGVGGLVGPVPEMTGRQKKKSRGKSFTNHGLKNESVGRHRVVVRQHRHDTLVYSQ